MITGESTIPSRGNFGFKEIDFSISSILHPQFSILNSKFSLNP